MNIRYRLAIRVGENGTVLGSVIVGANKVVVDRRDAAGLTSSEEYTEAGKERLEIRCYTDREKDGPEVILTVEPE